MGLGPRFDPIDFSDRRSGPAILSLAILSAVRKRFSHHEIGLIDGPRARARATKTGHPNGSITRAELHERAHERISRVANYLLLRVRVLRIKVAFVY